MARLDKIFVLVKLLIRVLTLLVTLSKRLGSVIKRFWQKG